MTITALKKVVRLGTVSLGKKNGSVYCSIKYVDGKLSITGVEGPLPSGNALGSCGQIEMHLKASSFKTYAEGWTYASVNKFLDVWRTWHLNDMKAGCEHQRLYGWEKDGYDKHPSEPCPTCGYKFGTAWNRVDVPNDVLAWLEALPETDKQPAWC